MAESDAQRAARLREERRINEDRAKHAQRHTRGQQKPDRKAQREGRKK